MHILENCGGLSFAVTAAREIMQDQYVENLTTWLVHMAGQDVDTLRNPLGIYHHQNSNRSDGHLAKEVNQGGRECPRAHSYGEGSILGALSFKLEAGALMELLSILWLIVGMTDLTQLSAARGAHRHGPRTYPGLPRLWSVYSWRRSTDYSERRT
jgi:hypothetical protein